MLEQVLEKTIYPRDDRARSINALTRPDSQSPGAARVRMATND